MCNSSKEICSLLLIAQISLTSNYPLCLPLYSNFKIIFLSKMGLVFWRVLVDMFLLNYHIFPIYDPWQYLMKVNFILGSKMSTQWSTHLLNWLPQSGCKMLNIWPKTLGKVAQPIVNKHCMNHINFYWMSLWRWHHNVVYG